MRRGRGRKKKVDEEGGKEVNEKETNEMRKLKKENEKLKFKNLRVSLRSSSVRLHSPFRPSTKPTTNVTGGALAFSPVVARASSVKAAIQALRGTQMYVRSHISSYCHGM